MSVGTYEPDFDGSGLRIGIVQARFNEDVCHGLTAACVAVGVFFEEFKLKHASFQEK